MKYFCSKCGKTTLYSFDLPKFCSSCGQSFSGKTIAKDQDSSEKRAKFLNELKLKKNINDYIEDVEEQDIEDIEASTPNINFKNVKPSFKVDIYQSKGESFGSLLDNPSQAVQYEQSESTHKTKEEILLEFQKEAGALRSK